MKNNQGAVIAAVILALLLVGVGIWGFNQSNKVKDLTTQNASANAQIEDLAQLKLSLTSEVDSLQSAYSSLTSENETLKGDLATAEKKTADTEAVLVKYKKQAKSASGEATTLRQEIEALLAAKNDLNNRILTLEEANATLRGENERLTVEVDMAKTENTALKTMNSTMQTEVNKLTLETFKASAFNVTTGTRRDKATVKGRRAKSINVSFDLANVPAKYQGDHPIYLVITDDKGTPIKTNNPINAKVKTDGGAIDIIAVQQKDMYLNDSQRITFAQPLEEKLKEGYYRVSAYSDLGMLGSSIIQLR